MSKKTKRIILLAVGLALLIYIVIGLDNRLETNDYTYSNSKIPADFDGYKILVISDLECRNFGENQSELIAAVHDADADLIVLTGDIIHEDIIDISSVDDLLRGITSEAPIYFVSGNHDIYPTAAAQYEDLHVLFEQYGVVDLDDASIDITRNGSVICLRGQKYMSEYVDLFLPPADTSVFNILLYHGSNNFNDIVPFGYDLVISGHAHGGIIRLPFVGGLFGNDGNFFPEYDGGMFVRGSSTLISSRGLANTPIIPRFYNRPELVVITLSAGS